MFGLNGINGLWARGLAKRRVHLSDFGPIDLPRTMRLTYQPNTKV